MSVNLKEFDSLGGFSIDQTSVIDKDRNAKDFNSLELKNSFFGDSTSTKYILRGVNTAALQLDDVGTQIALDNNTVNFITGHIVAVNPAGVLFAGKLETAVSVNGVGATTILSTFQTIVKDDIPSGETWSIEPLGSTNRFTYNTVRAGTTLTIKWAALTEVISITWA